MFLPFWVLGIITVIFICTILRLTVFKHERGQYFDIDMGLPLVVGALLIGILIVLSIQGFIGW